MPWLPDDFHATIVSAERIIEKEFGISPTVPVYLCSLDELKDAVLGELEGTNFNAAQIESVKKYYLNRIIGKFFRETKEIWLLEGKGDNLGTLVHELLHSIQKCAPNIENIVDYLTYKLTGSSSAILQEVLSDWSEIERLHSYGRIKRRLITEGDCEEF